MRIHLLVPALASPRALWSAGGAALLAAAIFCAPAAVASGAEPAATAQGVLPPGLYAEITTPRGTLVCELAYRQAPLTVTQFVGLAEGTLGPAPRRPFFDGLRFHRVVPDFVVQGGDPLGTGDGGPGYTFPDEFVAGLRHDAAGVLSMANDGPDTNGSQFFITLRAVNRLNYLHSVFGRVVSGLEQLPHIRAGDTMSVRILRVGTEALSFHADPAASDALQARARRYAGPREPGPTAFFDDPDHLLPADPPRAKNFNFKLGNFERATGARIRARLFARFTPEPGAENPGSLTQKLAGQLDLDREGAFAAYFADRNEWSLWIGRGSIGAFTGRPGTAEQLLADGSLHREKHAFLTSAGEQARLAEAEAVRAGPGGPPMDGAQRIKLQTDAVLDGLIDKLEP